MPTTEEIAYLNANPEHEPPVRRRKPLPEPIPNETPIKLKAWRYWDSDYGMSNQQAAESWQSYNLIADAVFEANQQLMTPRTTKLKGEQFGVQFYWLQSDTLPYIVFRFWSLKANPPKRKGQPRNNRILILESVDSRVYEPRVLFPEDGLARSGKGWKYVQAAERWIAEYGHMWATMMGINKTEGETI